MGAGGRSGDDVDQTSRAEEPDQPGRGGVGGLDRRDRGGLHGADFAQTGGGDPDPRCRSGDAEGVSGVAPGRFVTVGGAVPTPGNIGAGATRS